MKIFVLAIVLFMNFYVEAQNIPAASADNKPVSEVNKQRYILLQSSYNEKLKANAASPKPKLSPTSGDHKVIITDGKAFQVKGYAIISDGIIKVLAVDQEGKQASYPISIAQGGIVVDFKAKITTKSGVLLEVYIDEL